ncbi:MAG: NAD(P)-binding domain-containing protein [Myxococcales bacterium]|nr:NAD(P)-binding domain-containing protein [Myxococcales bacterium]
MAGASDCYCIIGAGAAGIAAARVFKEAGLAFDVLEKADGIGGVWDASRADSAVSQNTHTIGSKSRQIFPDFPMPEDYPDYPGHALVLRYIRAYAAAYDLEPHVQPSTEVTQLVPCESGWEVTTAQGDVRAYAGVVIATGHDRKPRMIQLPGAPSVEVRHTCQYQGPAELVDKSILVIGAGQSAADLLSDGAVSAARTLHSTRRGFYCMPKYMFGLPTDFWLSQPAPLFARRWAYHSFFRFLKWRSARMGLPVPDLSKGLVIPMLGDLPHHHYTHGDIVHRPGVTSVDGDEVTFADGQTDRVDVIYLATGFLPSYPFVDPTHLNWAHGALKPTLYLNIFPPEVRSLFVVGMVRPIGTHWDVYDRQARLVVTYLQQRASGGRGVERFEQRLRGPHPDLLGGLNFYNADEYPLIVEKQEYLRYVAKHMRLLGATGSRTKQLTGPGSGSEQPRPRASSEPSAVSDEARAIGSK